MGGDRDGVLAISRWCPIRRCRFGCICGVANSIRVCGTHTLDSHRPGAPPVLPSLSPSPEPRAGAVMISSEFVTRLSPPRIYRRFTEILNLAPDQLPRRQAGHCSPRGTEAYPTSAPHPSNLQKGKQVEIAPLLPYFLHPRSLSQNGQRLAPKRYQNSLTTESGVIPGLGIASQRSASLTSSHTEFPFFE